MTMLLTLCLCFLLQIPSYGPDTNFTYIKTDGGVILCSKEEISGNTQAITNQIISNRISRLITSQQKTPSAASGLIHIYDASSRSTWGIVPFLMSGKNYGPLPDIYESARNIYRKEGIRTTCTGKSKLFTSNKCKFFNY